MFAFKDEHNKIKLLHIYTFKSNQINTSSVCMKVQAHNSLEPPLEHNQDQPLMNQGLLMTFLTILGVTEIL